MTKTPVGDRPLIARVGLPAYTAIGIAGAEMLNRVAIRYDQNANTGGTRQDAIRHSSWNAFATVQVGKEKTLIVTTANEFHGQYFGGALASNCTMDLHNNDRGATVASPYFGAGPSTPFGNAEGWIDPMEHEFDAGELWAWTPPNASVTTHWNIFKKSNRVKIFPP